MPMTIKDLIKYFEVAAPPESAWERDNVGLIVGSEHNGVNKILLALEITDDVVNSAIEQKADLILTHHPFIFDPLKKINFDKDPKSQILQKLIKNDINVYSAHTNLDFAKDGVSFNLAEAIGLKEVSFLENLGPNQYKLVVFVPETNLREVSDAVFKTGAGIIGEYSDCSFNLKGTGTFKGSGESSPVIGEKEKFEMVDEVRLEILVESWKLGKTINAMLKAHPYEEPAYDIYPLKNKNVNYGSGAVGFLPEPVDSDDFLKNICEKLGCEAVRYNHGFDGRKVRKVAVCGGSGSGYLTAAIAAGCDAFVTADIKYHTFEAAGNSLLLIDAGHYETEKFALDALKTKLTKNFAQDNLQIEIFRGKTNHMKIFKL